MKNKSYLLLLLIFTLYSCESLNPFEKEGEYIEKRVELDGVYSIQNNNIFKIILVEDENEYLLLKGGENNISKVKIKLNDNKVSIDHSHGNNYSRYKPIVAEFHLKEFKEIITKTPSHYYSQGTISGDLLKIEIPSESELVEMKLDLDYKQLIFHSYGNSAGGYEFSGSCPQVIYTLNGIININASQLQTETTQVTQNGIGEAHVWAINTLDITIYASGNIYYKGSPEISISRIQVNNQRPTAEVIKE